MDTMNSSTASVATGVQVEASVTFNRFTMLLGSSKSVWFRNLATMSVQAATGPTINPNPTRNGVSGIWSLETAKTEPHRSQGNRLVLASGFFLYNDTL